MPALGHRGRNQFYTVGDASYIQFFDKTGEREAEVVIDTEDLERVLAVGKWNFTHGKYARYEGNASTGYKQLALHQFIMGVDTKERVRFANGETRDCRKCNLRLTGRKNPVEVGEDGLCRLTIFDKSGNVAGQTLIDQEDIERVTSWGRWGEGNSGYIIGTAWHPRRERTKLHRFVMDAPEGSIIDHINGDVKDNRKCNLRFVTHAQNLQNTKMSKNNTTGVRNVYWHKRANKYMVRITVKGGPGFYGLYYTLEEAAEVAEVKRRELHTHARI